MNILAWGIAMGGVKSWFLSIYIALEVYQTINKFVMNNAKEYSN